MEQLLLTLKLKILLKGIRKKEKKNTVVTIHQAMCCTNESEIFFTLLEASAKFGQ